MSIFKEFSISSRPESDEPVVIYDKNNNTYTCINNFVFDILYYKKTSKIRRWCGEDRERKNIFKYYSSDVKWAYMKDIVKIFFSPFDVKELVETDDTNDMEISEILKKS